MEWIGSMSQVRLYLVLIAVEGALARFVIHRARTGGGTVRELVGGRWMRPVDFVRDLCIAAATWGTWKAIDWWWERLSPSPRSAVVTSMLPHAPLEIALWIVLSLSAGFAEELAFRGAMQRAAEHRWKSRALAVLVQAVVFGAVHGYQGIVPVVHITVYGVLFGVVARWRGSLRPGMMAHAWTDIAAGLFRI